jgi:D-serine deaminase-like pyridoxal phosphate-dependent protein
VRAGAVGIACATVAEAEALAGAGIGGLLLTTPIMGAAKFARVAALNRSGDVAVVVDHAAQVEGFRAALRPGDRPLRMLIDVDVGQARTGVTEVAEAVLLSEAIARAAGLAFAGIQGYAGHVQHIVDPAARRAATARAADKLRSVADALAQAGRPATIISGSGTGTWRQDACGPYNELQAGSYVFMDADYARIVDENGAGPAFEPSLFVLATVVSVNRPGEVTVDAGTKALATNGPAPCVIRGVPAGGSYRFWGDEHGIISIPAGQAAPPLGARVLIGATHCDPTVNLHASYVVVGEGMTTRWPVCGRYS